MRVIESSIEIDATPEQIWAVVMDFPAYGEWNPFIPSITGSTGIGDRLIVRLSPPEGMGMTMKPRVTAADPERHFAWLGRLGLPRIFDGAHEFIIEPTGTGGVTFTQRETFHGILVPFFGRVLTNAHHGFEAMNAALKARVEAGGTDSPSSSTTVRASTGT